MGGIVFFQFLNLETTILPKPVCMKIDPFVWNLFNLKKKKKRQYLFFSPKSSMVLPFTEMQQRKCVHSCSSLPIFRSDQGILIKLTYLSFCHRGCHYFIPLRVWEMEGDLQFNHHDYTFRSFHPLCHSLQYL